MSVVTRFAPSPTGFLHIGGARTALFNWLYAKANNGKFVLRIEDTDTERSTPEAVDAILAGLEWLGLTSDESPLFQSKQRQRHIDVANSMVESGRAFKCYVTPEELTARRDDGQFKREAAKKAEQDGDQNKANQLRAEADQLLAPFRSPYRDGRPAPSSDAPFVIRLKAPDNGKIEFDDAVQGAVGVNATAIDDLVLLRSDGTPTYMLAVVVDDHDMGVTQIIRGDDHLANTYRQLPIYRAMEWTPPKFAHVPLIHGPDGKKLSKRHGALGVEAYRDMGYLKDGVLNYLLRLGWAHGDDEIIPTDKAIEWFNLEGLNKAAARLDFDKMAHINAHYMANCNDAELVSCLFDREATKDFSDTVKARIKLAIGHLKTRASTLEELEHQIAFLTDLRPIEITGKLRKKMKEESLIRLSKMTNQLKHLTDWTNSALTAAIDEFCESENIGMGMIGPTLRAALTGGAPAPDLGLVLEWLGREESLARIDDQLATLSQ